MHIVHITSSLKMGGAETCLRALVRYHAQQKHEQTVLYFHDGPIREEIELTGVKTYRITGALHQYDPIFLYRLYNKLKQLKPDIIHSLLWAGNFFGVICARLLGIPIVSALHAMQEHEGRVRNFLTHFTLSQADKIIAVAPAVKISAQKKYDCKPDHIMVITNGIDRELLLEKVEQESITREKMDIRAEAFIIGSVGRFVAVKNYSYLLEICARFMKLSHIKKQVHVILVGVGPELDNLRNQAHDLGIANHVTFINGEPAYRYYKLFDCFVQPSLFEGLSIALLEALSCGITCIVAQHDNQHEVIKHLHNGILVTHNKLLEALELAYFDTTIRENIKASAIQTIQERYTLEIMGSSYEHVFHHVISLARS
jgi:glycosyltransferase involved in cell wall biosynthesis